MNEPLPPICRACHRFFRAKRNGYYFLQGMRDSFDVQPGLAEPEKWEAGRIWVADLYACPGCGAEILTGYGRSPVAEKYQDGFAETARRLKADQFQVNDG